MLTQKAGTVFGGGDDGEIQVHPRLERLNIGHVRKESTIREKIESRREYAPSMPAGFEVDESEFILSNSPRVSIAYIVRSVWYLGLPCFWANTNSSL